MKHTKNDIVFTAKESGGLLKCVRDELASLPSGTVKSFLTHGQISVDGTSTTKFDYPVKIGQTIRISRSVVIKKPCPFEVLYEDDVLFAVNKPAGLLSVASDTEKEKTAIRLLREGGFSPLYVVHRLDRETSGVLLFSKNTEIRDTLQDSWDTVIRREYLAICEGVFEEKSGRCDTFLRETKTHLVYSAQSGDGKRAITNYTVIKEDGSFSLLRILIETGRKNQIRVHMKELGHPVAGDKKYGAHGNPLGRIGLHASVLELKHPVTGDNLVIEAPAGKDFKLPKPKP